MLKPAAVAPAVLPALVPAASAAPTTTAARPVEDCDGDSLLCPGTPGLRYDGVRVSGLSGLPDDGYHEPDSSSPQDDDGDGRSPDRWNASDDLRQLASIAREPAYNGYEGSRAARGERQDRNIILPLDRPPLPYTP